MTKEEQRFAIAEACGLLNEPKCKPSLEQLEAILEDKRPLKVQFLPNGRVYAVPDYLSDLNAMHDAEETIAPDMIRCYQEQLVKLVVNPLLFHKDISAWVFHATAAQRAEAFLKTIGRWKDK